MPNIDGVVLTPLKIIPDERGQVMHVLRSDSPQFTQFGEVYISCIYSGVIKGWKLHTTNAGNLAIPVGRVKFVLHDLRENSPTKGQTDVVFLGDNNYQLLSIPPGVAYGWKNLVPQTAYVINCASEPHQPGEAKMLPIEEIPHPW